MKTIKFLTICFVVCCMFTGNLLAQVAPCSSALDDSLGQSGNIYFDGETIEYTASLEIANPGDCTVKNIQVYFFAPDNVPNNADVCAATNGVLVYESLPGETLGYGDPPIVLTSAVNSALAYLVDEADGDAGGLLYAYICTKFVAETPLGDLPDSDTKSAVNAVIAPDFMVDKSCVNPEGTLIGEDAEFEITVTNTGDIPLYFVLNDASAVPPLEDVLVGPVAPDANHVEIITIPTTGECDDDLLVPNDVIVEGYLPDANEPFDTKSDIANCPVLCPPAFTVSKTCLTDPVIDEPNALFEIVVTNTGYVPLEFEIDDLAAGIEDLIIGPVNPGDSNSLIVEVPAECVDGTVSNRVIVQAYFNGSPVLDPMPAEAECPCGAEGCTPGFWKNNTGCWACYSPTTLLNEVFDFSGVHADLVPVGNKTMLKAMKFPGGSTKKDKIKILLRHAVPAILNACNDDVFYPGGVDAIIGQVNAILADYPSDITKDEILGLKNDFAEWNELGCPISADNSANPCMRNDYVNGY